LFAVWLASPGFVSVERKSAETLDRYNIAGPLLFKGAACVTTVLQ
jgi:hypothetical protein